MESTVGLAAGSTGDKELRAPANFGRSIVPESNRSIPAFRQSQSDDRSAKAGWRFRASCRDA